MWKVGIIRLPICCCCHILSKNCAQLCEKRLHEIVDSVEGWGLNSTYATILCQTWKESHSVLPLRINTLYTFFDQPRGRTLL